MNATRTARPIRRLALLMCCTVAVAVGLGGVGAPGAGATPSPTTIRLVTHDSFAVSKPVLAAFEKQTGIKVQILQEGDAGAALNQAILTKDNPLGDVFFGVDNTFLSRALDAGIFETYTPKELSNVPSQYQLDPSHQLTPIDHGDVCVVADKQWFTKHKVPVPTSMDDLTKPAYKGLLVTEDPATSSPGLVFTLATVAKYGESGWRDYWSKLRSNDLKVDESWDQAYNGDFTAGGASGSRPLVVSYATDPAAAVVAEKHPPATSPVSVLLDSCFQQVEFAGVLMGTTHEAAARKFVDFLLSTSFQADVPLEMYVYPVRDGTQLPAVFTKYAAVPTAPLSLPAAQIGANRDQWIDQWRSTVVG
jgi:thiamine transport system substrate-binding protein